MESLAEKEFEKLLSDSCVVLISISQIEIYKPAIGEGGFGKVYKGKYLENSVAIKKIKLENNNGGKKQVYSEILNEIKVIQKANHSNIPFFFGILKNKQYYHLVFEFIEGTSWRYCYEGMERKTKLNILLDLCGTLEDFHGKKLIHRDIKPDNVMIEPGNKPRLIDFGVSKIATKTSTFSKVQMGTVPYMAPEMFNFDEELVDVNDSNAKPVPVSTYSDIWSLGCMISEVFSGLKPWHKKKESNLTELYIIGNLTRRTKFPIPSSIDEDITKIITKATIYEPTKRSSARELKEMISQIISLE